MSYAVRDVPAGSFAFECAREMPRGAPDEEGDETVQPRRREQQRDACERDEDPTQRSRRERRSVKGVPGAHFEVELEFVVDVGHRVSAPEAQVTPPGGWPAGCVAGGHK
jgi:hypothetical protein